MALSELRLSSHRLLIESVDETDHNLFLGNSDYAQFVIILKMSIIFLFECWKNERVGFLKPYYFRRKSMFKAVELMQSSNAKVLQNLAVYVYKCFEIRNAVLLNNDSH